MNECFWKTNKEHLLHLQDGNEGFVEKGNLSDPKWKAKLNSVPKRPFWMKDACFYMRDGEWEEDGRYVLGPSDMESLKKDMKRGRDLTRMIIVIFSGVLSAFLCCMILTQLIR